jgi:hypothetical protein
LLPVVKPYACRTDAAPSRILVAGGAGFIGSHTVIELVASGYVVTIFDSLVNSKWVPQGSGCPEALFYVLTSHAHCLEIYIYVHVVGSRGWSGAAG